jgi:rhomboid family protein
MNTLGRGFSSIPPVLKNLLIINVLMFLAMAVLQRTMHIDLNDILGLYYFKSEHFAPYQYVTHMFMHANVTHIFLNMFMLWMFGRVLEQVWGGKRFLFYYLFTGLGAAALHTFVNYLEISHLMREVTALTNTPSPEAFSTFLKGNVGKLFPQSYNLLQAWSSDPQNTSYASQAIDFANAAVKSIMDIPTVGASGAVYGVLLAFGMIFPNMPLVLIFLPFFPIKAKYMVIAMGVLELVYGLTMPGSNVAHFAHLGGMIFGFILIKFWKSTTRNYF